MDALALQVHSNQEQHRGARCRASSTSTELPWRIRIDGALAPEGAASRRESLSNLHGIPGARRLPGPGDQSSDSIERHTMIAKPNTITGSPEAPRSADSDPFRDAAGRLRQEIDATFAAFRRSRYVDRQLLGLTVFDGALRVGAFLCLGAVGVAVALAATALLVGGARRGLALWSGGAWWSDIVLALGLALLLPAVAHLVRRGVHRSALSRTRLELARTPASTSTPDASPKVTT